MMTNTLRQSRHLFALQVICWIQMS